MATTLATRGMNIPAHDYIENTYNGSNQLILVTYKIGGASGTTVATQALTYDGSGNVATVTKTNF